MGKGTIRRLLQLFSISFIVSSLMFAQQDDADNPIVRNMLDNMFEHLDKSKVPTGLLKDYAYELIDMSEYNGISTIKAAPYIDRINYEFLLRSINSAALNTEPIQDINNVFSIQKKAGNESTISLSIALYEYSYIKENALRDNLIRFENEQVFDNYESGVWKNPYNQNTIFAFSVQDSIFTQNGGHITAYIPKECFLSNIPVKSIDLDLGNGFQNIKVGEKKQLNVPTEGSKEIILKVTLKDGKWYCCKAKTNILSHQSSNTLRSVAEEYKSKYITTLKGEPYKGVITEANIYQFGNRFSNKVIILVEGFDPKKLLNTLGTQTIFSNQINILQDIFYDYTIYYIDWENSEELIQANAQTLEKAISFINRRENLSAKNKSILIGHSIGGVISRYALRKMENKSIPHHVGTYVSYDAPHLGANIPVGILYGTYGILSFYENKEILNTVVDKLFQTQSATYIEIVKALAYSPLSRQILVNFVNESGQLDRKEYILFQKELEKLGFPKGDKSGEFKSLAISNSSFNSRISNEDYVNAHLDANSIVLGNFLDLVVAFVLEDFVLGIFSLFPSYSNVF